MNYYIHTPAQNLMLLLLLTFLLNYYNYSKQLAEVIQSSKHCMTFCLHALHIQDAITGPQKVVSS